MPFVRMNPRRELSEFYPPPYNFLAPRLMSVKRGCPLPGCACKRKRGMGQGTSGAISSGAGQAATAVSAYNTLLVGAGIVQSVPVAGQIIGAALAITAVIAGLFKGCGQTCILTTEEVNKIEPYMQQNVQQYLAAPPSPTTQQEALANFNQLWQAVVNYCNQPSMASAGQRCISDRAQGSCKYRTSPGGWQQTGGTWKYVAPGSNGSGTSCWNWFIGYHDPIANDPRPMAAIGRHEVLDEMGVRGDAESGEGGIEHLAAPVAALDVEQRLEHRGGRVARHVRDPRRHRREAAPHVGGLVVERVVEVEQDREGHGPPRLPRRR
jgi:hypothetical protein